MYWKDRDHPESDEIPIILPNIYLKKAVENDSDAQIIVCKNPVEVLEPVSDIKPKRTSRKKDEIILYFDNESGKSLNDLEPEDIEIIKKTALFRELRDYRLQVAKEQGVFPYFIFYDRTLFDIVLKMPSTKEELAKVFAFGERKANKYGEDVLKIIDKHRF